MGQKLNSKLLFIFSPNIDEFHKVVKAVKVWWCIYKIGQCLAKTWTKVCVLLFGHPVILSVTTASVQQHACSWPPSAASDNIGNQAIASAAAASHSLSWYCSETRQRQLQVTMEDSC